MKRTYDYCDKYDIPYKKVGKMVVATNDLEEKRLLDLWDRPTQNNVSGLEPVGAERAERAAAQDQGEAARPRKRDRGGGSCDRVPLNDDSPGPSAYDRLIRRNPNS